ncbi:MAG: 30S ribosomal protein S6 [Mycoplasmataceae bacterium]|nr:30S ribosomal protein S6 [Mycoplasmataceae bacterium]
MAKYEIMLVVDGSLDKKTAESNISDLVKLIEKEKNYKVTDLGNKDLAYKINGQTKGWYFIYNFETEVTSIIAEFRRLVLLNRSALRHLIINLEKEYGYKATINEKKIKFSQIKAKKYEEKQKAMKAEWESREKAQAEFANITKGSNNE